jgi:phosphatidate cytidylyltransferase
MLRTRVITALVLVGLLAGAALVSHLALTALCAVFLGAILYEWLQLAGVGSAIALAPALAVGLAVVALEALALRLPEGALAALCAAALLAWLGITGLLVRAQTAGLVLPRAVLLAAAPLLGAAAWFALLALLRRGEVWTLSVLALVWLADIAAYFAGRSFGKRKLASRVSPGKTWAGVVGALAVVLGGAELLRWAWPAGPLWSTEVLRSAPLLGPLVLALAVGLSVVGDLFESLVKRQAGVKDSGRLLPGHGGAWDRLDACLPVLPLAVLVQVWGGGGAHG